jgi:glycopeptide antibiotics resistance protein
VKINRLGAALSVFVLIVILVSTLTPVTGGSSTDFWCLWCGGYAALDIAANIVMFTPLGFALALATNWRWRSVLACVVLTVGIELLQIHVVAGRDASFSDILANSLGGLIGVELAVRRLLIFRPAPRAAVRLVLGWCVAFMIICGLTVAGLRPATVPRSLWVQWTPPRQGFLPFSGRLLGFQLNEIPLPLGYPSQSLGVDTVLRGPTWQTTATVSTEGLERRRSIIARIAEEFTVIVSVEQTGWSFTCVQKTRSSDLRFRSPKVGVKDGLLGNPEVPSVLKLTCGRSKGTLVAGVDGKRQELRLSPSLGWLMLSPFDIAMGLVPTWVSAFWLFGLVLPVGYWIVMGADRASATRRVGLTTSVVLLAMLGGLIIAPSLADTALAAPSDWAGALCGLVAGVATGVVVRRWWPPTS